MNIKEHEFCGYAMYEVKSANSTADNICTTVITGIDARTDLMTFAMSDYVFWPVICVFTLYCGGGVARYFRKDNKND